jgi:hypothetical protein
MKSEWMHEDTKIQRDPDRRSVIPYALSACIALACENVELRSGPCLALL